jgi:hypothetical protein
MLRYARPSWLGSTTRPSTPESFGLTIEGAVDISGVPGDVRVHIALAD